MNNKTVVTRIAPSPTGFAHIGTIRTALFNWLYARLMGGTFFIRFEDTDQDRFTPGAGDHLLSALRRVGLHWDAGPDIGGPAGPYIQSQRLPIYREQAEHLLAAGHLYKCWCSKERLDKVSDEREANGLYRGYDGHCRHLSDDERKAKELSGAPFVIRLVCPTEGETVVNDLVRGTTVFQNNTIGGDRVMIKSDGYPVYHFASVVDDHMMGVTHVMRGIEWLASTPTHLVLYSMFGWEPPQFGHLSLVNGEDGQKLSKRNNDASVDYYLDELGLEPEAVLNILALTGVGFPNGTADFKTLADMTAQFDIHRLIKPDSMMDKGKLDHLNGMHLRHLPVGEFIKRLIPYLVKAGYIEAQPTPDQLALLSKVTSILQPRIEKRLREAPALMREFYEQPTAERTMLLGKKGTVESIDAALAAAHEAISTLEQLDPESIGERLKETAAVKGMKRELLMAARVAVTGKEKSLPLFETIAILGKDETLSRLTRARAQLA